jgi:hypothetical protein
VGSGTIDGVSGKRPSPKPHKSCYFCGGTGRMSKEHAWPQWLGKGAVVEATRSSRTVGYRRTAEDTFSEDQTVVIHRNGSVLTARVREVCERCNGGWMSRLEDPGKPLLRRLWSGVGGPPLAVDDAALLSTWASKTAWMHERVSVQQPTASAEMRSYLRMHRLPPSFTAVWAARHVEQLDFHHFLGHIDVRHQDRPWDSDEHRHVLMCSMAFKGLAMLVRTDDGDGVPPLTLPPDHWRQLWPVAEPVPWPPPRTVDDYDVRNVAVGAYRPWLQLPDLPNFVRDSRGDRVITQN